MSWLSQATGIHLGNIGAPIGALAGSFIGMPQLGAAVGQGVGALGQKKKLGQAFAEGAGTYATTKLAGAAGGKATALPRGFSLPPGIGIPGFQGPNVPGPNGPATTPQGGGNWWDPIVSGIGSAVKGAASYAKDNPLNVAMAGLAAAQALAAAKASARQGRLSDEAIGLAKGRWAGAEPLRTAGQTGLLKPPATDYNSIFADPTNPFASAQKRSLTPKPPSTGQLPPQYPVNAPPATPQPPSFRLPGGVKITPPGFSGQKRKLQPLLT